MPPGQAKRIFREGQRVPTNYRYYTPYDDIPMALRDRYDAVVLAIGSTVTSRPAPSAAPARAGPKAAGRRTSQSPNGSGMSSRLWPWPCAWSRPVHDPCTGSSAASNTNDGSALHAVAAREPADAPVQHSHLVSVVFW